VFVISTLETSSLGVLDWDDGRFTLIVKTSVGVSRLLHVVVSRASNLLTMFDAIHHVKALAMVALSTGFGKHLGTAKLSAL